MASPVLVDSAHDYPFAGGTVPWPASVPEGDLIVIQITSQVTGDTITLDDGTYTALPSHGSSSRQNQTFFKTAGASESAPIYNAATSTRCVVLTLIVSGGTLVYDDSLASWTNTAIVTFPTYDASGDFLAIKRAWSIASTSLVSGPTEGTLIHDSLSGGRGHAAWQFSDVEGTIATDSITVADQGVQSGNLLVFEATASSSYPVLGAFQNSNSSGIAQHTVTLPAHSEGDTICIIATTSGGLSAPPTIDQGYSVDGGQPNDTYHSTYVFSKVAGASEVSPVVTYADNETFKAEAFSISNGTIASVVGDSKSSSGNTRIDFPASTANADATILRIGHIVGTGPTVDTPPNGTLILDNLPSFGIWSQNQAAGAVAADELLFAGNGRASGLTVVIESTGGGGGGAEVPSIESVGGDNSLQVGETGAITRLLNGNPNSTIQSIDIGGVNMPINSWTAE